MLNEADDVIGQLKANIAQFKQNIKQSEAYPLLKSDSAIQCIVFNSNEGAKQAALTLQNAGLDVRAILSPTVPLGTERLRICLHSYNSTDELNLLTTTINNLIHA